MLSPRSKRTTAMRPCGPSPFSTLTKRRSMRRSSPVRATVAPRLYKREPLRLTASMSKRSPPSPSNAASTRCSPATPSPARPAPSSRVMREGEIELCKGYGLASIELGVPIAPTTRFRIASVSKQFTVTAALMLAAEGKLKLSDPPHKYLKELTPLPVTIDQMMRNSSGLPDFLELLRLGGHGLDKPARAADLFAACVAQPPSQLRAGQPLPLQQHQLPAARPHHREADQEEARRRAGRAHLQAARHDRHDAGGRHRHGDPQPRHRLSRRRTARASAAPRTPIRRAAKAASPRRSRTC